MDSPFASIVIPTRGRPAALQRALRSVLAQDLADWEAIVVDDGDGEGVEAALELGDERIRPRRSAGRGQVDARLSAIAVARGTIVCWLDDDDWWEDAGHLTRLRAEAGERRFLFRGGHIVYEDASGVELGREPFDHDATDRTLRWDNTILTSSIAYPRAAHRELGLLDRELGGYCDWDFMLRMCDAGILPRKVPGAGVCYAVHETNLSRAFDAPERRGYFERFKAKHGLDVEIANHERIHRMLSDGPA